MRLLSLFALYFALTAPALAGSVTDLNSTANPTENTANPTENTADMGATAPDDPTVETPIPNTMPIDPDTGGDMLDGEAEIDSGRTVDIQKESADEETR